MKSNAARLQQIIALLLILFFNIQPIQAGFPVGTRIATQDFPITLKAAKTAQPQNLFRPQLLVKHTTIAYPSPPEEQSFFSVFKSPHDAKNFTVGNPYEYSASYAAFLQAYEIDVALQAKRCLDAPIARTINEILHDMYAVQQHFGHFYEVGHLNAITTTLIKTILTTWSQPQHPYHRSTDAIIQLLEAVRGFQRAGEQLGQYRAQSTCAHLYTPQAVSHAVHNVLIPFEEHANRIISYSSTLPSALTLALAHPVNVLQSFYVNQDHDAQAIATQCQAALAPFEEEEQFIVDAAKAANQAIPVVTPLTNLKHQVGNAPTLSTPQASAYSPAAAIMRGKTKSFNQQLTIIDQATGTSQDVAEPIDNFIGDNIII